VIDASAGIVIPAGYTLSQVILDEDGNPMEYQTDAETIFNTAGSKNVVVSCKVSGIAGNIPDGSEFLLMPNVPGINTITDGGTTVLGIDVESDESLFDRYYYKVTHPDTGGNKYDYTRWVSEVTGTGKCKVIPLWDGNGTVKVVLLGTDYNPASAGLVTEVQEYLDPESKGLGEGKAPCGAKVTVVAATQLTINIAATVTYDPAKDQDTVKAAFCASIAAYLKELAFNIDESTGQNLPIAYVKIGALLITTPGVINYDQSTLLVNGATSDIIPGASEVAALGTVTI
jgi:uncharacterized phage protein gp47/JayE